ncbi:MAG: hypothetical protein AAB217_16245 [Chloroflexota bacterium]
MLKRLGFHSDEMLLAFAIWLCALPLVGLILIPLFGFQVAGLTALMLLFIFVAICWGGCGWKIANGQKH